MLNLLKYASMLTCPPNLQTVAIWTSGLTAGVSRLRSEAEQIGCTHGWAAVPIKSVKKSFKLRLFH